jgi:c-di-GMP-binding flagellar brake protein YcgR
MAPLAPTPSEAFRLDSVERPRDRRRVRRLKTRVRVDYCPLVGGAAGVRVGHLQRGVATDISEAGILLSDVRYLPLGATLHLLLRLPDLPGNAITCYAKVVRAQHEGAGGYGLRFLALQQFDARRLRRYVTTQLGRRARLPSRDR